ncbi:hypothetical protein, partial [Rothia mucilaginosa]|uniref:hypothetical protein n=1 Tax=Rothia mucilaginosa TaxID=43675 RepID=UPI001957F6DF
MSSKMNSGIKYIGIFCVSVLSASLLISPTAHAEECTNPNSNGHCYKVPNPPNRRSRTADKNKEENSEVPSDSSNASQSINQEYFDYETWFKNNYQSITDEIGATMHARKTQNRHPGEP